MSSGTKKKAAETSTTGHGVPEIDARELELGEIIGKGSFGTVYRGKCRGVPVAVKVVDTKGGLDQKALDAFRREVEIVSSVFSPHVTLYMACTSDPRRLMIVTELMKTDLEHLLRDKQLSAQLTLYRRLVIARDAALGMAWLHGADPIFIHRDIKPSNFLVDDALHCKVTDFGLSQIRHRGERLVDRAGAVGTPLYMAPEVLNGAPFTEKSDVYSFGLVLWVLLTGKVPYSELDDLSNDSFADSVCSGHRPELPADTPPDLRRLIKECWSDEPSQRPTAVEIVDAVSKVVLAVAILDERGRTFWAHAFGIKEEVYWRDVESQMNAFFDANADQVDYVRSLFSKPRDTNIDVLTLEWFGKALDWFGPTSDPSRVKEMFVTLSQPWFHGDVATADAERMLRDQPIGSFLVRFSNQSRGYFTISRVAANNAIHHQRVLHKPLTSEYAMLDRTYATLRALIAGESTTLKLTSPCPGSRFHNISQQRATVGYLLSPEEQSALSRMPIGDEQQYHPN